MVKKIFSRVLIFSLVSMLIMPSVFAQITTKEIISSDLKISNKGDSVLDLLIITPACFVKSLEPLKEHKNKYGVRTKIVTLDQIYNEIWYGRDKAEKIKLFIWEVYKNTGIKYVLLVGNFRKMPIRYAYNGNTTSGEPRFISDLYYADIIDKNGGFSSWDTNNNGIYGEWNGTEAQDKDIDLYPDVYVGRLACRTNLEVKIMVDKIITYETKTYGSEWYKRIVVAAGDTYPPGSYPFPTPEYEGEVNAKTVLSYMPGFTNTTLFTSEGTLTGADDIINETSKGCGFLYLDGHGNPASWTTHLPNQKKWIKNFMVKNISKLTNGYKLPICVVSGCHNLEFDTNIFNLLKDYKKAIYNSIWVPECWGWKLTRKIGGGSIATIGCTGLGMTKEDKASQQGASDYLDPRFFYEVGINGSDKVGEAWGKAITDYLDKYPINWNTPAEWDYSIDAKTVQQWVLLGDPSLKIGGYPPQ